MLTRRRFLLGGAAVGGGAALGAAGVWTGALPGRVRLAGTLGRCDLDAAVPDVAAPEVETGAFTSRLRGTDVRWALALPELPPGAGRVPVVLVLHGRGADSRSAFDGMSFHRYLAAHVAGGGRPLALAAVDGGDRYWHPRQDGDDPLGMLTEEFLPLLAERGLRTGTVGALGWSMGGYAALLLAREAAAGRLGSTTVAAVAASSPALFPSYADTTPGAFDDAQDFERWGALLDEPAPGAVPQYVGCGDADAFTDATRRYREVTEPEPAGRVSRGCHDGDYWRSVLPEQLAFLGDRLPG